MKKLAIVMTVALAASMVLAAGAKKKGIKAMAGSDDAPVTEGKEAKVNIDQMPKTGQSSCLPAPGIQGASMIGVCYTKPRKWIVIETKYTTYAKFLDQLTFNWHVLLETKSAKENKGNKMGLAPYSYFNTTVTYYNIPQGSHAACVCLPPSYLELYGEPKAIGFTISNANGDILQAAGTTLVTSYCDLQTRARAPTDVSVDPVFSSDGYAHLLSEAGYYADGGFAGGSWTVSLSTSPLIDGGDPDLSYDDETQPNGHRANIGAYAGTAVATRSKLGSSPLVRDDELKVFAYDVTPLLGGGSIRGTVASTGGGADPTVYAVWDSTDHGMASALADWANAVEVGTPARWELFTKVMTPVSGLTYCRLIATNEKGTAVSNPALAFTPAELPTLSDAAIVRTSRKLVTVTATLQADGGSPTSVRVRSWPDAAPGTVTTNWCNGGYAVDVGTVCDFKVDGLLPATDYRIFEVASNATVSLAYVPAERRELSENAPTKLTVDEDMVVYPVKSLGPTCDGGTIEKDKEIGWVVTPNEKAGMVIIEGLPEGETVAGVRIGDYVVPSGAFDGFAEGKTEGEFSLALDPTGEVTIGTETIPVQPTIGELDDGEPFVVGEGSAAVTVKAIPGLRYGLERGTALSAPAAESSGGTVLGGGTVWGVVGESVVAEDATVTLTDSNPPEGAAFYRVAVSMPGGESPSESGGSDDVKPTPTNEGGVVINLPDISAGGLVITSDVDPETLTIVSFNVDSANSRVLLKVSAETTANVNPTVAGFLNVTVRKGAEVIVKVEHADSPAGPWTELQGVGGRVTVDRAGADIEVKLDGELPAQGYFRAKIEE